MTKISPSKTVILVAMAVSLLLGGCETIKKLNPFGGSSSMTADQKKKDALKKYDHRPVYTTTGDIPPDSANAKRSDEDLKAGK